MASKRKCKLCGHTIGDWNKDSYCSAHQREGQKIKDGEKDRWLYSDNRVRQKARYRKEKEERDAG